VVAQRIKEEDIVLIASQTVHTFTPPKSTKHIYEKEQSIMHHSKRFIRRALCVVAAFVCVVPSVFAFFHTTQAYVTPATKAINAGAFIIYKYYQHQESERLRMLPIGHIAVQFMHMLHTTHAPLLNIMVQLIKTSNCTSSYTIRTTASNTKQ
jgi:hypothetical protein